MRRKVISIAMCAVLAAGIPFAGADPVRNGNELALEYVEAAPAVRKAIVKRVANVIHTFRYLRIVSIVKDQPEEGLYRISAIEPSSDMLVVLDVVAKKLSLDLAASLKTNDYVAANGRVNVIEAAADAPARIVVAPAILRFKDRGEPKAGAEALHEVDPTAK